MNERIVRNGLNYRCELCGRRSRDPQDLECADCTDDDVQSAPDVEWLDPDDDAE